MISAELKNNKYYIRFNGTKYQFNDYINKIMKFPDKDWDLNNKCWTIPSSALLLLQGLFKDVDMLNETTIVKPKIKNAKGLENIGKNMKLSPYLYQKEAIKFCIDNMSALLVLPCGAGKTPVVIGAYLEAIERSLIKGPGLVIVKASLKTQWVKEVEKFTDLKANIIQTKSAVTSSIKTKINKLEAEKSKLNKITQKSSYIEIESMILKLEEQVQEKFEEQFRGYDLYILNYETLKDEDVRKALHKFKVEFVGADEIQQVKNHKADRSKAVYEFSEAKIKIGATATPIQKDYKDLFGLFSLVNPTVFDTWKSFEKKYIVYAGFGKISKYKNTDHLKKLIMPYTLVKQKEDISDQLPKVMVIQRYCSLTDEQARLNAEIMMDLDELKAKDFSLRSKCKSQIEAENNAELMQISGQIMALQTFSQELADDPLLFDISDSQMLKKYAFGKNKKSPKTDLLIDLIDEIIDAGEKVCVFSKYERMQSIITDRIKKAKIPTEIAYVNGSISDKQRYEEIYTKFRDDDKYKVLLASNAMAEGANLSKCKYIIEFDLADSYGVQTQRHGRIQRADSIHKNVTVYQLITQDSWDEIQAKIIEKKEGYDAEVFK